MTLSDWMASEKKSVADVAKATGYHRTFIWKLIKGHREASRDVIVKLCAVSGGKLTPADFFAAPAPKRPARRQPRAA